MNHKWFDIRAQDDRKTVDVSVRGIIGEFGASDRDFTREIEAAGDDVELVNLTINSRGGDVDHGLAIYNYLRNHKALVSVRVDGIAASAASIIAMAGDEIVMPANALMMVHNPWTIAAGNAKELRKTADDLEQFENALLATYTARTGKSDNEVRELVDAESWLTAEQAANLGFADKVESLEKPAAAVLAEAVNIPQSVLAKVADMENPSAPSGDSKTPATPGDNQGPDTNKNPPASPQGSSGNQAQAAEIVSLCVQHNMAASAASWIREGITMSQAQQRVLDAKAQADEQRETNPIIEPDPAPAEGDNAAQTSWSQAFSKTQPQRGNW